MERRKKEVGPFVGAAIPIVAFELIERYRR
jgi:hypothetical protein